MIPFNKPYSSGSELAYIDECIRSGDLCGDGRFTKKCQAWLEERTGAMKALLTHSCTAALEMAAILADIKPGDEVIMPSYAFVSAANAVVLRGGVPVFVDIRKDTLNLDESLIEGAITKRTRAIMPVHYGGVACEMDSIMEIANKSNLVVIEDAAQGMMSNYKGRPLGTIGQLAATSFHETKNIVSGEGGALFINRQEYVERAEIVREKGTDRSKFMRGEIDKYSWVDIGSSYLPSDFVAAFLWGQMEAAKDITNKRVRLWNRYHEMFEGLECAGAFKRPTVPSECKHNAHMYYITVRNNSTRNNLLSYMQNCGIGALAHYVPLHRSEGAKKYGRACGVFSVTDYVYESIVRLPLYARMVFQEQDEVIESVNKYFTCEM